MDEAQRLELEALDRIERRLDVIVCLLEQQIMLLQQSAPKYAAPVSVNFQPN
jgi:hypothetical protein